MDEFDKATEELAAGIDVVQRSRETPVIRQFIKTFKESKGLKLDGQALRDEIRSILASIRFTPFALQGKSGIDEANEARFAIRAGRDRVIAMNGALRDVLFELNKRYKLGRVWLRLNEPEIAKLSIKEADEVMSLVLSEIHERLEEVKGLLVETKEAVDEFNDKVKLVDAWTYLHKEYTFHNSNRRIPHDDEENKEPQGRGLGPGRGR